MKAANLCSGSINSLWFVLSIFITTCSDGSAQIPPSTTKFPNGKNVVELPFTRYRGWIILQARVNDQKTLSFILDTGAPIAVLADKNSGESLALNIMGQAMVSGGDGQAPKSVPLASGVKFTLGELEIENCLVAVGAASDAISGVDGVIGKYVFENSVVEINWQENKLIVSKPEHYHYKGNGEIIPIKMASGGHIYGEVMIEKNGKQKMIKTVFDTGNRSTLKINNLEPGEIYADAEAIKNVITGWGANGPGYGDLCRVNVKLGNFNFSDVIASSKKANGRLEQEGINGNIGLSVLERFNIVVDYQQNRLILEKNEHYGGEFFYNQSGILTHPKREPDHVLITGILPGSSAAENGLMKGDKIIVINGKPLKDYSTDEIDAIVLGKTGNAFEIEIERNKESLKRKITLKKLI